MQCAKAFLPAGFVLSCATRPARRCSKAIQYDWSRPRGGLMLLSSAITERVRGEFREMPGLTLTVAQARRLWSLDSSTCSEVLSELVDAGFLCRKADGAYGRASDLA